MVNINTAAFQELIELRDIDYSAEFNRVLDSCRQPEIPQIGESIPRKADGTLKHTSSMTPVQRKKALAISGLAAAVLAATIVVTMAILLKNPYPLLGLIPAVGGGAGCVYLATRYFKQLDLASPKQRQKETERLRTRQLTMTDINKRYSNFSVVVAYKLLGEASEATYQQGALLCAQQAKADRCYNYHEFCIKNTYVNAIKPARDALDLAEWMEMRTTAYPRTPMMSPLATVFVSCSKRAAQAQYDRTVQDVKPAFDQVMNKLDQAYRAATLSISSAFQQLPLNA